MGSGGLTSDPLPDRQQTEANADAVLDWDEWAAWYIAIGVPAPAYWDGCTEDLPIYARAHELKVEQKNQELWLQGLYVHEAFGVVLSNAFGRKGASKKHYPSEPYRITPLTAAKKKANAEKERQKALKAFQSMKDNSSRNRITSGVSHERRNNN